jgi:pSer/pThr/pTyr-binding forkhead associated (FHA) protein
MQSQDNDKTVIGGLTLNFLYSIISEDDKHYPIDDKAHVGRGTDSTVLINDKKISRNHAELVINEGRLQLIDLNSSNGTFLNGKKITEPKNLTNGDLIAFEKHVFTVKIEIKEDEIIEEQQETEEEDNDHTSIVEMSDEYFNKLNKAVESFETPVKPEVPVNEKIDVLATTPPSKAQPKTPEPEAPKAEAPKPEAPKAEAPKQEAPKV